MNTKKWSEAIPLEELSKDFTPAQWKIVEEERRKYDLYKKVQEARKKKGLTQAELSSKAKINRSTLSQIENGLRNVTFETIYKIADALEMEFEYRFK